MNNIRKYFDEKRIRQYEESESGLKTFTAYIVKGNRQVIKREVNASKKFRIEDDTYVIVDDCIFNKLIDGVIRSVAYYTEGNPMPYNFKDTNNGLSTRLLNKIYSGDFYKILIIAQYVNKFKYVAPCVIITLILSIVIFAKVIVGVL